MLRRDKSPRQARMNGIFKGFLTGSDLQQTATVHAVPHRAAKRRYGLAGGFQPALVLTHILAFKVENLDGIANNRVLRATIVVLETDYQYRYVGFSKLWVMTRASAPGSGSNSQKPQRGERIDRCLTPTCTITSYSPPKIE